MKRSNARKALVWVRYLLVAFNLLFVAVMLFVGYSGYINPASHPLISTVGLIFPFTIIPVVLFLVLWLFLKPRYVLLSFVGLLLAYSPIRSFGPINYRSEAPDDALKIVSYNVMMFGRAENYAAPSNSILQYLRSVDADIVCLQEAESAPVVNTMFTGEMSAMGYRSAEAGTEYGNMLVVYSKFPILSFEPIVFKSSSNLAAAARLLIDGDTVLVINAHFESNKLTEEDKEKFQHIIKRDKDNQYIERESRSLLEKLAEANQQRAPQVDKVAHYIDTARVDHVIVCGDFNDHPNSYTLRTLRQRLTDCYVETGIGPGFTYLQSGINVRIDHILCSKSIEPYQVKIDNHFKFSDHQPIRCKLVLKK